MIVDKNISELVHHLIDAHGFSKMNIDEKNYEITAHAPTYSDKHFTIFPLVRKYKVSYSNEWCEELNLLLVDKDAKKIHKIHQLEYLHSSRKVNTPINFKGEIVPIDSSKMPENYIRVDFEVNGLKDTTYRFI